MSKFSRTAVAAATAAVLPVVTRAPQPDPLPDAPRRLTDLVERARQSGLDGEQLVNRAISLVNGSYSHFSAWHLWEGPQASLRGGRGRSVQYNVVLATLLAELGFEVRTVHAARVRRGASPWWASGHTWVQLRLDGLWRDADASSADNRLGVVDFEPLSQVRPLGRLTAVNTALGLVPFVTAQVWRQWLLGESTPGWLYRPFDQQS